MSDDFFLGFAGHAHTMNELVTDPQRETELRRKNNPEKARKLVETALDKVEKDLSKSSLSLKDVKLLILYSSYRGETAKKDELICKSILKAIEDRLKKQNADQVRLIGHTTAGELENEDLILQEITGIGYNGISLLALATNLPIGVGRTWGLRTPEEAGTQGREMTRDAWVDFSHQAASKEHLNVRKTLFVLTHGLNVDTPGYEHFLAEGIANFMGGTREARIMNVIGGTSGDGLTAKITRQFYGRLKEHTQLKILNGEATCALIPDLKEVSLGLDIGAITRFGRQATFHFDSDKEPHFKYIRHIGKEEPAQAFAQMICQYETQLSKGKGRPPFDKKVILDAVSDARAQQRIIVFSPVLGKYAFTFPFGNYTCFAPFRIVGGDIEISHPVRSYTPEMPGYLAIADHEGVQRGARHMYDMLRADLGFSKNDATLLISCINRRVVELMAGSTSGSEAEILKEGLSSTQVIGFLAYGEMSFTHFIQEPYYHAFSLWGMTFHSKEAPKHETDLEPQSVEIMKNVPGRVQTGSLQVDRLLFGGIPENCAVVLTSPAGEERGKIIKNFLEKGAEADEVTFFLTADPSKAKSIMESKANFHLFVCNPQADAIIKDQANTVKLKGVENLTNIGIALSSAISKLDPSLKGPRRICIELLSDILLQHHAVQTRRWLTSLITELKSNKFTALAVIDPQMHPSEELHAILGLFDGEINIREKETERGLEKFLKVKRMSNQKYLVDELLLRKEDVG